MGGTNFSYDNLHFISKYCLSPPLIEDYAKSGLKVQVGGFVDDFHLISYPTVVVQKPTAGHWKRHTRYV